MSKNKKSSSHSDTNGSNKNKIKKVKILGPIKEEGNDCCKIVLKEKYLKTV